MIENVKCFFKALKWHKVMMEVEWIWLLAGMSLITFGILHEILLYWLQLNKRCYSRIFGKYAFAVHGVQLGGTWILVGLALLVLIWRMPHYSFHHHILFEFAGILLFPGGFALMGGALYMLGWERVLKIRLFSDSEPSWVEDGLFRFLQNPMYTGSQTVMLGIALFLNSWFLLIYTLNMFVLQKILAKLENHPPHLH
ncbi:MAG: hypothetical protein HQM13_08565 [SAR324 cluster bacterium]|nr:hypothetical protein [SAR324 cluster bacterium]